MKRIASLTLALAFPVLVATSVLAQTEFVRDSFFPAEQEFGDLGEIKSDETLARPASLSSVQDGALFEEASYDKYARRTYSVTGGELTIEVVRLKDARAAYSLLTVLRKADITPGPPGDAYSAAGGDLVFSRGNFWVRIRQSPAAGDLARRVAISVSNRIGNRASGVPLLVTHFPKEGYQESTVRYYLGPKSYDLYATAIDGNHFRFESDMEVAQARYDIAGMSGLLSLVSFPTSQMAEERFDDMAAIGGNPGSRVYLKRVGPLLGILQGSFDTGTADRILDSIKFAYAIKWIYDKNNRSNSKTIWGVPVPVLGTVVGSLLFTGLLCAVSLLAGAGIAAFRFFLRGYAPHNYLDRPERTEMIRLKLNEK